MSRTHKVKIGDVFGRLTVVEYIGLTNKSRTWRCICECGNETTVVTGHLLGKTTPITSCGCLQRERASAANFIHGGTNSPEYATWLRMKSRCFNLNSADYADYGGRGIIVCDEWKDNFPQFLADMGQKPTGKYSIERLNVNGNYEPTNCVWADDAQQARNRRNNHMITYGEITQCMIDWAEELDINYSTLRSRINDSNWSIEKAFTTPVQSRKDNVNS